MKLWHKACLVCGFISLLPLILLGCAGVETTGTSTPVPTLADYAAVTPSRSQNASPGASPTFAPTKTGTPTATLEPTQTPTPTRMPADEVQEWISKRLVDNGGCRLPCWWGITPGKTTWEETYKLISPYASEIRIIEREDHFVAGFFFNDPPVEVQLGYFFLGFGVQDDIVLSIRVTGVDGIQKISLSKLMEEYGKPGEVFVYAYHPSAYTLDPRAIGVHLYYPEQGIFAEYASPIGKVTNGIQQGCIEYGPDLTLVPPGQQRSYMEFVSGIGLDLMFPFRPVTEALGMDEEAFYNKYKGLDQAVCLETPIKIWVWGDPTPPP